jgi:metal-dependent hydrolase (beta-lactamase superfamily II)
MQRRSSFRQRQASSAMTISRLAELDIETLAPMHCSAFTGDCRKAMLDLADDFDRRINAMTGAR